MPGLLIAESLFLLMRDPQTGRWRSAPAPLNGLAGALLLELAELGFLRADGKKLVANDGEPDHPLLRSTLDVIRRDRKPRTASYWVQRLPSLLGSLDRQVAALLEARGVVREDRRRLFLVFTITRWPTLNPAPGTTLRARLAAVLVDGMEPEPRERLLVALLDPLGLIPTLVERHGRKAAKARAKELTQLSQFSKEMSAAVAQAVHAVHSAAAAATVAGAAAATASAGS